MKLVWTHTEKIDDSIAKQATTMAISRPQRKRVTHECLTKSSGKNVDGGLQAQLEED